MSTVTTNKSGMQLKAYYELTPLNRDSSRDHNYPSRQPLQEHGPITCEVRNLGSKT
jgi:hypothetical protein